jgi:hypothetical protein
MKRALEPKNHQGSCHCGKVRFEVDVDATAGTMCNCSVCTKLGAVSTLVKPAAFRLLEGEASLGAYEWGAKISRRFFCWECGVYCFGRGHLEEVGGDYVSVHLNCLDGIELTDVSLSYWDGRHDSWQAGPRPKPWPILPVEGGPR